MSTDIRVRRVYDDPSPKDGARVLVDRVWPRGLRKDAELEQPGRGKRSAGSASWQQVGR